MMPDWFLVLTLIVVGFILLLIELLIIPGFGLIGVLGLGSLAAGSYTAYTKLSPMVGVAVSLGSLLIVISSLKLLPKSSLWKRLRLESAETQESGFGIAEKNVEELIGKEGHSITPLRPTGTATIEGRRIDVVTEGVFLPKDVPIKVVKVEGNRAIVREVK